MGFLQRILGPRTREHWLARLRLAHRAGATAPPEAVQWIATSACDLTCPHCYSHAGRRREGELTLEQADEHLLRPLARMATTAHRPLLVLAGGEAPLRPDFREIVARAGGHGVPWALHTHGGHEDRVLAAVTVHRPDMVAVSVDGPEALHDRFRGREGSFARALSCIEELKEAGVADVVAGTTVTRRNADHLADLIPSILASRADSWGLHLVTPEGRAGAAEALLPTPSQIRRVAALARSLRGFLNVELDNEWGSAGADDPVYRDTTFACGAGRLSCVVTAAGELVPCTTTDGRESAGNVTERPLEDLWREGFEAFRLPGDPLRADCDDCWLQTRHGHSCRRDAFGAAPVRTVSEVLSS